MRKINILVRMTIHLIFVMLSISGLTSCATVLSEVNIFSVEDEIKLGNLFSSEMEKELTLYTRDPVVTEYINELGQRLVLHSNRNKIAYHFKVVDAEAVNAFALPGGYVYVHLGLIRAAENESELAGVMGHEIGHVVGRHGAKQLTKQLGFAAVQQLVLGKDPNQLEKLAANVARTGTLMKYSRDAEREADAYAVQRMYDDGIDPEGVATFFETLRKLQKRQPGQLERFFSTHPPTDERIQNVRSQIARRPRKPNLRRDSLRFHEIKKRLPPPKLQK